MELCDSRDLDISTETSAKWQPEITLIVPCYNETAVLRETNSQLKAAIEKLQAQNQIGAKSGVIYVDDGSSDGTWQLIEELSRTSTMVRGIKLSRNRGHQNALLAGLLCAHGDALISVDADLQDDLAVIPEMIDSLKNGYDVVYGVRRKRDADTYFKRMTAEGYYRLLAWMNVEVVFNHADYRLLSRRALESLRQYKEVNLFLRGLVPLLGYSSTTVEYDRIERFAGESKYPLGKMLALAWQGITSFSTHPLRLITILGFFVSAISLSLSAWALLIRLVTDQALPGWASTVIPMYFLGGIQILSLGVIGEYIAKIYNETKARPRFHIEETIGLMAPDISSRAEQPRA